MDEQHITPESTQDTSRRAFIAKTAFLASAAGMLGACSTTGSTSAGSSRPIIKSTAHKPVGKGEAVRMAVIGTGGMGTAHCNAFLDIAEYQKDNVKIVALADVCDSKLNAAKKTCEERQGHMVATYRDYRDLLAREDIHGVLIASPEHWHATMAVDALGAGKDVYVEKPMTIDLDEALWLRKAVHANPHLICQVGTQMIMLPRYQAARDLIKQGAIGKPVWSQTSYCRNSLDGEWLYYAIDPDWTPGVNIDWEAWCGPSGAAPWDPEVYARWRRYKKYSTGIIGDLLVHQMTPLMMAIDQGWPTRVVATGGHYVDKAMENPDQVNLQIQFEDGHTMIVAGSTANEVGLETMVRGHEANLYLGGRHCVLRPERLFVDEIDERTVHCEDIGNDQDQLRLNWLECIRTRRQPDSDVELGCKVMVAVDLAARSIWEGSAFEFDPETKKVRRL